MPPVTPPFTLSREFNESVTLAFSNPQHQGFPSAWSDTITTTIFGVAALITASISIWQTHRYLHGLAQLKQAQADDVEKAVSIESSRHGQSGPSGFTSNVLTISGETIRTTPDEFFGLEAPPPVRLSFENDIRKSGKESDHVTLAKGPSSIGVSLGQAPQPFCNDDSSHTHPPEDLAALVPKLCEFFFSHYGRYQPSLPPYRLF